MIARSSFSVSVLCAVAACGGAQPAPGQPAGRAAAPLSTAADERMIAVPAGPYIAGSTPEERAAAYDDHQHASGGDTARVARLFEGEADRAVSTLPGFRIDLLPVTQAQYAEAVTAGVVPAPAIDEAGWRAQGGARAYTEVARFAWRDGRPSTGREDHPVVLVTQPEAVRYCAWRGQLIGEPRRLPTAAEYEKAARGDSGQSYPWGNTFVAAQLDSAEGGTGDTAAVGTHPGGASPYGVLDLAGNAAQWTSTPTATQGAGFVTKGSSWADHAGLGRGAARVARPPATRDVTLGFRCAADAPPSSD